MLRKSMLVGAALVAALLALSGTASAAVPVKLSLGPVPVPSVPLEVCVGGTCTSTPPAQSVSLVLTAEAAKPGVVVTPPTITPSTCPGGAVGLAAKVIPGSAGAKVTGSVEVAVNGGSPVTVPVDLTLNPGTPPATISACVG